MMSRPENIFRRTNAFISVNHIACEDMSLGKFVPKQKHAKNKGSEVKSLIL